MRRTSRSSRTLAQRGTASRAAAREKVSAIPLRAIAVESGSSIGLLLLVVLVLIVPLVGAT